MTLHTARLVRRLALAIAGCLALGTGPALAQPVTLTPEEIASLKARLNLDTSAGPDASYSQEVVDVVETFRRHGALSPSAFRDLSFRYVPLFDAVAADDGSLQGMAAVDRGNHLAYSATVRLRLMTESSITGAWILANSGVPRANQTDDECIKAGSDALDHGIAYIVAHELAHKELGHNRTAANTRAENRARELAADWRAFEILYQVRFSLPVLRELLRVRAARERAADPVSEASSSHPLWSTRVRQLDRFLGEHPPDLTRGGVLAFRRWSGSEIQEEAVFVREGPPRWMAAVAEPDRSNDQTPRMQIGYAEHGPGGTLTIWTRSGPTTERRQIEPIAGQAPGWMQVRSYKRQDGRWAFESEARALLSTMDSAAARAHGVDLVSWYTFDPGADMLSGVPEGPQRQRLQKLAQLEEEERRRTMKSYWQGDFGVLELTDRLRLSALRMDQTAWEQGVASEWSGRVNRLLSAGAGTTTGQALGEPGREMLQQLIGGQKAPIKSYRSSDGRFEFRLPGQVEPLDIPSPPGTTPGARLEAHMSTANEMLYAIVLITLPHVPSPAERQERLRQCLLGAMQAAAQNRTVKEIDRRAFDIDSTTVLEAAVQVEAAPVLIRLRAMATGRYMVMITTYLGAPHEQDVIDGWRVIER